MSCCVWDSDSPEFVTTRWVVAKKPHKCCECKADILPGTEYEYVSGKWDEFLTFKTCEKCADLRESLSQVWCISYGDLKNNHWEYLDYMDLL